MKKNFGGEGLWSLSKHHPDRTFVEGNPFLSIDQQASDIWVKLKRGEKLSSVEFERLALFLNSIYCRQPEVIEKMREVAEKGLLDLDGDHALSSLVKSAYPSVTRNRNLAFSEGLHFSDVTVQSWLSLVNDQVILDDILASHFHLLHTPTHSPIPLSDRPYVTVTLGPERMRMFPVGPHALILLWKRAQNNNRAALNIERIYKLYLQHSISAAQRGVVVTCPRSHWKLLEWFRPTELWLDDFGPGTDNPTGRLYPFGESYALSQ